MKAKSKKVIIVDVRIAYIRKIAFPANSSSQSQRSILFLSLEDHLTLIHGKPLCKYWSVYLQ